MFDSIRARIYDWFIKQLDRELPDSDNMMLSDFDRVIYEVRPGDVLLIAGKTWLNDIIRIITQSPWSHAVLYVGRIHDVQDALFRKRIQQHIDVNPNMQMIIESVADRGTIISPIQVYRNEHIRICRPRGIAPADLQRVLSYAIGQIGKDYDIKQILDLARLLLPWRILPKRWKSSLFDQSHSHTMRKICSTMLAEAFGSVNFPILPVIRKNEQDQITMYKSNARLFTPRDFDFSPYFDIIKYPFYDTPAYYRNLPWADSNQKLNLDPEIEVDADNKDSQ